MEEGNAPNNTTDQNGFTAFGLAAYLGKLDVARALIVIGFEVNLSNDDGVTPIVIAAYSSSFNEEIRRVTCIML